MTRMGNLRGQRRAFIEAREKQDATDLASQTLRAVMAGTILVQVHCYRADEMLSFLELAQELGFKVRSFHHAGEAYKIAKILAREDVSVSTWADWWGFKLESWDGIPENAAFVHAAGGRAVIHSDSAIGIQRLNQEAAKALAFGRRAGLELADGDAIRWLTANPAWTLGIEHETGQLAPGRRADLVVWEGDPFSVYSRPRQVFVDGRRLFDATRDGPLLPGGARQSDYELQVAP